MPPLFFQEIELERISMSVKVCGRIGSFTSNHYLIYITRYRSIRNFQLCIKIYKPWSWNY